MLNNTFGIPTDFERNGPNKITSLENVPNIGDSLHKDISTSINMLGFFERLIDKSLKDILPTSNYAIKPAFNKESPEDLGNPVITIRKTSLEAQDFGIFGDKSGVSNMNASINTGDFSLADSYSVGDLITMYVSISVFGFNLAEVSKIQEAIFDILFASSYGTLSEAISCIKYVKPPVASEVMAQERNMETYVGGITFSVEYLDRAYLLARKNLVNIARIIVNENDSKDTIWSRKDLDNR